MIPRHISIISAALVAMSVPAYGHPVPFSYVDVRVERAALDVTVVAHVIDVAHDLKIDPPERLLETGQLNLAADGVVSLIRGRLTISADARPLGDIRWSPPESLPDRQSIRLRGRYEPMSSFGRLDVGTLMFPYDPQHKTFLNIYEGGSITAQAIRQVRAGWHPPYSDRPGSPAVPRRAAPPGRLFQAAAACRDGVHPRT
jgi:hypothetical protein